MQQAYLKAASFGGVQDEELFKQVLAVGGHVEGNPVFATQHALSQLLVKDENGQSELMDANINITFQSGVASHCLCTFIVKKPRD